MKQRDPAMDLIRCLSLVFVVAVHFFKHSHFYDYTVTGTSMIFMVMFRCLCVACTPLFLTLSGYLQGQKKLSRGYYKGLIPLVGVYVMVSFMTMAMELVRSPETFSLRDSLWGILSFGTANYAWYVELYLGLYLLIPFLNGMYHSIAGKKKKTCFILTLMVLTVIPGLLNSWNFTSLDWWKHPGSSSEFTLIFPEYWIFLIPLVYYFLGMYLREFPLRLKAVPNFLLILAVIALQTAINYYRSYGYVFQVGFWSDYGALPVTVLVILIFTFFQNRNYTSMGQKARRFFAYCSSLVYGAYLCSGLVDQAVYPLLDRILPKLHIRFLFYPLIVLVIVTGSMILSAGVNAVYKQTEKLWTGKERAS